MSDLNIDRLSIEIEANSNQASKQIDKLSSSLNNLKTATTGFKLTSVSNQINKLAVATSSLNNAQFSNISKNIGILSNAFNGLKNIGTIDKTVTSTINSLTKLNGITNSLKGDKLVIFANQMKQVASAIQPLTELGKSNLGGALNQLKKLPETVQILEKVDMQKFTTQMKSLAKAIEPVAKQSQKMSTVFSRFPLLVKSAGNQFTSFNAKLNKTNKASSSLSATLGILRSKFIAIQFAGSIFTTAFTSAFEESSAYIENLNLFNVAMGECTTSALQFAQSVQDAMGIDISEWLRYQGAFNMMITGFGVSGDKAQIMSQNLTQLAYDYSSLMNIDVESAFDKLNSAMSGQIKGLKEFGNNVSVAMVKETGLKYGLDGAVSSWHQNTQAMMRYITIINNASNVDVFNDMARTIATPANAVRILTQQFTMLKRAIGNIASVIASAVIPYIQIAVQLLTQLASWFANLLGFKLPEIDYSGIAGGGADAEDSLDSVGDSADSTTDKVKELKKQLMGFDELNIINKPSEDKDSGKDKGNGGGSVGDIELPQYDFLKGLEAKTNETLDRITKKMADFFKPVSDSWDKYGKFVTESFEYSFGSMIDLVKTIASDWTKVWKDGTGEKTVSTIFQIVGWINTAIGNLVTNFKKSWEKADVGRDIIKNIWDIVNILLGSVKEVAEQFALWTTNVNFDGMLGIINNLTGGIKYLLENIDPLLLGLGLIAIKLLGFSGISSIISGFGIVLSTVFGNFAPLMTLVQTALAPFQPLLNLIVPLFETFGATAGLIVAGFVLVAVTIVDLLATCEEFRESFFSIFESVFDILQTLWNGIGVPIFGAIMTVLKSVWENGLKPLYDTWKTVFTQVFGLIADLLKVLSPIIEAVVNLLGPVISAVLSLFTGYFSSSINSVLGVMNGLLKSVGDIIGGIRTIFKGIVDFLTGVFTGDWSKTWEGIKGILKGVFDTLEGIVKIPLNAVIGLINGVISGIETGINFLITCVNKLSFDVPDWVPGIGGETFGFDFGKVQLGRISYLAEGGLPDVGEMFVAREAGPELVGRIGKKSAVANNDQIIGGISAGVYNAVKNAMGSVGGNSGNIVVHAHVEIEKKEIGKASVEYNNGIVKQTGKSPLLV